MSIKAAEDALKSDLQRFVSDEAFLWGDNATQIYFEPAEKDFEKQWAMVQQFLSSHRIDYTNTLELSCGHGRNSERLASLAQNMTLIDVNPENVQFCKQRFSGKSWQFIVNNGFDLADLPDSNHFHLLVRSCCTHRPRNHYFIYQRIQKNSGSWRTLFCTSFECFGPAGCRFSRSSGMAEFYVEGNLRASLHSQRARYRQAAYLPSGRSRGGLLFPGSKTVFRPRASGAIVADYQGFRNQAGERLDRQFAACRATNRRRDLALPRNHQSRGS